MIVFWPDRLSRNKFQINLTAILWLLLRLVYIQPSCCKAIVPEVSKLQIRCFRALVLANVSFRAAYQQRRNEGGQGGRNSPGAESL